MLVALDLNKHRRPTGRTELVLDILVAELVGFELIVPLMKDNISTCRVHEEVAVLRADGAVAASDFLRV